ncbi:hypothetical protein F2P81_005561 [Scophthalmus maximus]|uniref:Uncharacterized protein n=1 Tax=Scophthalmus maximus TaxID=52904 RepID=A0A6A4TAW2_SCOMX|nr:hypothetical protein F2P81_005561 [Scophthalmus maximus]
MSDAVYIRTLENLECLRQCFFKSRCSSPLRCHSHVIHIVNNYKQDSFKKKKKKSIHGFVRVEVFYDVSSASNGALETGLDLVPESVCEWYQANKKPNPGFRLLLEDVLLPSKMTDKACATSASANGRKMSMSCRLWNADWSKRSLEAARQISVSVRYGNVLSAVSNFNRSSPPLQSE